VASQTITTSAAGTWTLGDLTVNRIGFGAMRLTSNADGTPSERGAAPIRDVDFVTLADLPAWCSGPSAQPTPKPFLNGPRRS
jgi:hypothetical protein